MTSSARDRLAELGLSVGKAVAMLSVRDVREALAWYESIGFRIINSFEDHGVLNFGMVQLGNAQLMFKPGEAAGGASIWVYTERIDELHEAFRKREAENGSFALPPLEFSEPINDTFYHARQFGICEPSGYLLYFIQGLVE